MFMCIVLEIERPVVFSAMVDIIQNVTISNMTKHYRKHTSGKFKKISFRIKIYNSVGLK